MNRTTKVVSLLVLAAAAIILSGSQNQTMAQATTVTSNASFPVTYEAVPCNADTVTFSGKMHFLIHVTTDASGGRHTVLEINTQGVKGVGLTGAHYTSSTTIHETLSDPESVDGKMVYTSTAKYLVVGHGKNPDFMVRMTTHITVDDDGNATPQPPEFKIECN